MVDNERVYFQLAALACAARPDLKAVGVGGLQFSDADYFSTGVADQDGQVWQVLYPRQQAAQVQLRQSLELLMKMRPHFSRLPFNVPQIVASAKSLAGFHAVIYPQLPGQALRPEDFEKENPQLARILGTALASLHDLPAAVARVAGSQEYDSQSLRQRWQAKIDFVQEANELAQKQAAKRLQLREQGLSDKDLDPDSAPVNEPKPGELNPVSAEAGSPEISKPTPAQIEPRTLRALGKIPGRLFTHWTHQLKDPNLWDFSVSLVHDNLDFHLLSLTEDGSLSIHGWTKLKLADPAQDLAWVLSVANPDFTSALFAQYQQTRPLADSGLLQRTELTAELLLLDWLYHGLVENDPEITADGYQMLRQLHNNLLDSPEYRALSDQSPRNKKTDQQADLDLERQDPSLSASQNEPVETETSIGLASQETTNSNPAANTADDIANNGANNYHQAPVETSTTKNIKTQIQNRIKTQAISTAEIKKELENSRWDRGENPTRPSAEEAENYPSQTGD